MLVSFESAGILMLVRLLQLKNVKFLMLVTPVGILMVVSLLQSLNALAPI
jgi:hypothetical protein